MTRQLLILITLLRCLAIVSPPLIVYGCVEAQRSSWKPTGTATASAIAGVNSKPLSVWTVKYGPEDNPDSITATLYDGGRLVVSGWNAVVMDSLAMRTDDIITLEIQDGVTEIDKIDCYKLKKLKSVTIPRSVTHIAPSAFNGCYDLASISVTLLNTYPPTLTVKEDMYGKSNDEIKERINKISNEHFEIYSKYNNSDKERVINTINKLLRHKITFFVPSHAIRAYSVDRYWEYWRFNDLRCIGIPPKKWTHPHTPPF